MPCILLDRDTCSCIPLPGLAPGTSPCRAVCSAWGRRRDGPSSCTTPRGKIASTTRGAEPASRFLTTTSLLPPRQPSAPAAVPIPTLLGASACSAVAAAGPSRLPPLLRLSACACHRFREGVASGPFGADQTEVRPDADSMLQRRQGADDAPQSQDTIVESCTKYRLRSAGDGKPNKFSGKAQTLIDV